MSKYTISDIENLVKRSNKSNKSIIVETIKNIIDEDNNLDIQLMNINKINNNFFKLNKETKEKNLFCSICQEDIKQKEHKVNLDCEHIFHKKCLSKLLKNNIMNFSCPNCKHCYKDDISHIISNISKKNIL